MVSTKLMTAEEFELVPETDCRLELVRGVVVRRPFKVLRDAAITANLVSQIWQFLDERDLGVVGPGCGCVLQRNPDTVLAPDVAFIRADRIPHGEAANHFAYFAPDLSVEILPPSGVLDDLLAKANRYLAAGTRLSWTLNPNTRTVVVKTPDGGERVLGIDDTLDGGDVLPGFRLPLRLIYTKTEA